ncbi:MAG TPA: carbohydrate binding domain-containing protein [Dehalococcoidales bacterium]|nr:carbohydrate binding domain-containing protein [Dehalococcoidales bacterium]
MVPVPQHAISITTPVDVNLLINPGFENGLNDWANTGGSAAYEVVPGQPEGSFAVQGIESDSANLGRLYQVVTGSVTQGKNYRISGWIKTQNVAGGGHVSIGLTHVDLNGQSPPAGSIMEIGMINGTHEWTYFLSDPFVLPPRPAGYSATWLVIDFSDTTGTAWFDDLFLGIDNDNGAPRLSVYKYISTMEIPIVAPGQVFTFSISFSNTQWNKTEDSTKPLNHAYGVVVTDYLPPDLEFVSASNGGTYTDGEVSWLIGTLPNNRWRYLELTVRLKETASWGFLVNQIGISAENAPGFLYENTFEVVEGSNLILSKYTPVTIMKGALLTFTLYYSNFGQVAADVVLVDTLPSDLIFVSASDGGTYDESSHTVTWDLGYLEGGIYGNVSLIGEVSAGAIVGSSLINEAYISTSSVEDNITDNQASAATRVAEIYFPPGVSVGGAFGTPLDIPSVYYLDETKFGYKSCDDATGVDIRIRFEDGGLDIIDSMSGGPPNWTYAVTFYPRHGRVTVTYTVYGCAVSEVEFDLYIDPAGYIYNTVTGERIAGAVVTLQRPDGAGGWEDVPIEDPPIMLPNVNPLITGPDGQYEWLTLAGSYRVRVEADGYHPNVSMMVTVPPPVFDLHVGLIPLPVSGTQRWNLDSNLIMEKSGTQSGSVEFSVAAGLVHIWLSDQAAQTDVTFPAGEWIIHLVTENWDSECLAQIGESDGITFNSFNAVPEIGIKNGEIITFSIFTGGTVPQGHYLALKISTATGSSIITAGNSYLKSPSTDPGYPVSELSAGILLGLGLAGMGAYLVLRRRKTFSRRLI